MSKHSIKILLGNADFKKMQLLQEAQDKNVRILLRDMIRRDFKKLYEAIYSNKDNGSKNV